ncbi:anti-sigma factor antagonist [Streptomyces sp. URMC 126]|uniref:STAS domain-containing protein n=1 Tax=Streptomyces sp. URMC 126 TaxID=3423401 RepID=UPI003F1C8732
MGGYELAFTMRERVAGGAVTIELSGEIDILAEQELGPRLEALAGRRHADLVIDLRGVTFLDASGLRLLLRVRNRVARGGGRLRVVRGGPRVSKVIRIVRLEPVFQWLDAPPGPSGTTGRAGLPGPAGPAGSAGRPGLPGPPVPSAPAGPSGPSGPTVAFGTPGRTDADGASSGAAGPGEGMAPEASGAPGVPGGTRAAQASGASGVPGVSGACGASAVTGGASVLPVGVAAGAPAVPDEDGVTCGPLDGSVPAQRTGMGRGCGGGRRARHRSPAPRSPIAARPLIHAQQLRGVGPLCRTKSFAP